MTHPAVMKIFLILLILLTNKATATVETVPGCQRDSLYSPSDLLFVPLFGADVDVVVVGDGRDATIGLGRSQSRY